MDLTCVTCVHHPVYELRPPFAVELIGPSDFPSLVFPDVVIVVT
jgi:hypothetical protein